MAIPEGESTNYGAGTGKRGVQVRHEAQPATACCSPKAEIRKASACGST
jgi:hypothetical protein